ncbi:hypothetical protein [Pseudomonas serbica]|uniref:hypothetical protein n=1 Tax=Pseudomonas serbica TaxID=2965074 RepID=UPI00237A66DC|nr:hypothetical protein [Pseudomonas serbica]
MSDQREFDVWKSDDGRWKATEAVSRFVDDHDAPYTFSTHVQRVDAVCARDALNTVRKNY